MSKFECPVVRVRDVQDHPNADRLNINLIGDYICISNKREDGSARYRPGDLVVYMPEAAILPPELLFRLGFWKEENGVGKGTLNGSNGDRIKAMKLRGVLSQGVIMPVTEAVAHVHSTRKGDPGAVLAPMLLVEGVDLAAWMGITKYEPPVPTSMAGQVMPLHGVPVKWDIENLKKYPDLFLPDEHVLVTEKIHGTCCQIILMPEFEHPDLPERWAVISKGLGEQGLVFKDNEANATNLYLMTVKRLGLIQKIRTKYDADLRAGWTIYVLGEIYGLGVQDLTYGAKLPTFAGFAIGLRRGGDVRWVPGDVLQDAFADMNVPMVTVLYKGPYDRALIDKLRDGNTTLGGGNIREGVVILPVTERTDLRVGRVIAKHVSDAYLTRKNATEFN